MHFLLPDGKAMSEYLPTRDFRFVDEWELEDIQKRCNEFVLNLQHDSNTGYMFEVDLEIPSEKANILNDYPPCPIKRCVKKEELSKNYQLKLKSNLGIKNSVYGTQKLIADLNSKESYVVHYRTLQVYLSLGVKINKIKRVVKFHQDQLLKHYIDQNTIFRNHPQATEFEKNFWKLMNNR